MPQRRAGRGDPGRSETRQTLPGARPDRRTTACCSQSPRVGRKDPAGNGSDKMDGRRSGTAVKVRPGAQDPAYRRSRLLSSSNPTERSHSPAECSGLLNRQVAQAASRVQIPPSPPFSHRFRETPTWKRHHSHTSHRTRRGVAQSGGAPGLGPGGRPFESGHLDHLRVAESGRRNGLKTHRPHGRPGSTPGAETNFFTAGNHDRQTDA